MAINTLVVYGTRPEAIKLAPLIKAIQDDASFNLKICVTGQHLELLDQVNCFFNIIPDFNLKVMSHNQGLNSLASTLLTHLTSIIKACSPDLIIVQGDTTTSFIAALAGYYEKVKVGHVEAGLRSFNLNEPYPEEGNRLLTSRISFLHFAPTERNVANLINENIDSKYIYKTGNTVVDALKLTLELLESKGIPKNIDQLIAKVNQFHRVVLVTAHRRENFGTGIQNICSAVKELAAEYENCLFVIPVHPNPNVKEHIYDTLSEINNIELTGSLEYQTLIYVLSKSYLILTDSGGIQEEAPSLGKPVLVLRNVTERQEAVDAGCVKLIGTEKDVIIKEFKLLYDNPEIYKDMQKKYFPIW